MKNNSRHTTTNTDRSERLTLEQFVGLAGRKPSLDGRWVYRLDHTTAPDGINYPTFDTYTRSYMFLTLDEAERHMKQNLAKETDTYCFLITQLPVGEPEDNEGARWLYDAQGRIVDYSVTTHETDPLKSKFYGRPPSRVRFKKGDIVEVMARDHVHLAVVAADFLPIEWFWGVYSRSKEVNCSADASDDCYYTIGGPGFAYHRHTSTLAMMKPGIPIPDDVKTFFEHCLEAAEQEDCTDIYRCFHGNLDNIKTLSETEIEIRFDKNANHHILVKKFSDNITGNKTYTPIKADDADVIDFLKEVCYGKTRLWYIIRDWNENEQDMYEPKLSLDTPIDKLIKNDENNEY